MNSFNLTSAQASSYPTASSTENNYYSHTKKMPSASDNSIESLLHTKESEPSSLNKQRVEEIQKAVNAVIGPEIGWEVSMHKDLNEVMVKVIDRKTKEVIREVPPEKLLDMVASMLKQAGLLIDEKW